MNILFTICGRAGSKGVKNKNVSDFCGCPLPYYTLAAILLYQQRYLGRKDQSAIALSTDSEPLKELICAADPEVVFIDRAPELAGDRVRKIDVIRDAAKRVEAAKGTAFDMVVDLDITSPLRTVEDLHNVIEKRTQADADVVYTVVESRRNPYFNMVMKHGSYYSTVLESDFASRQQAPAIYDMNASIYAYSRDFINDTEPLFKKADIVLMKDTYVLDIDHPEDLTYMQLIAEHLYAADPGYSEIQQRARDCAGGKA